MRLAFLIFIFLLVSCKAETHNKVIKKDNSQEYQKKAKNALKIKKRNDKLFLGYRFNMTMQEFKAHTDNLIQEGKILSLEKLLDQIRSYEDSYTKSRNIQFGSEKGKSVHSLYALRLSNEIHLNHNKYKYDLVYNDSGSRLEVYFSDFLALPRDEQQKLDELTLQVKNIPRNYIDEDAVYQNYPIADKLPTVISTFEKKYGDYLFLENDIYVKERSTPLNYDSSKTHESYNWFIQNQLIKAYIHDDTGGTGQKYIVIKYIDLIAKDKSEKQRKLWYEKHEQRMKEKNKKDLTQTFEDI